MSELPDVLQVRRLEGDRWSAPQPSSDPEGRDVIFSGQLLAQMMMVSDGASEHDKEVKSIHAVFARAGSYKDGEVEYLQDSMHAGRAWASDTITAVQNGRLIARALVLLNAVEPDLIRHAPTMPDVPGPDECPDFQATTVYPGSEVRSVERANHATADATTVSSVWVRHPASYDSVAANQAVVAWSEPGLIIGTAMRAHPEAAAITDAHRSVSTGVISHTAHFHEHSDVAQWHLFLHEACYAAHGRIFGHGSVFTRDGALVSTFAQDSMARHVDRPLDWRREM